MAYKFRPFDTAAVKEIEFVATYIAKMKDEITMYNITTGNSVCIV